MVPELGRSFDRAQIIVRCLKVGMKDGLQNNEGI